MPDTDIATLIQGEHSEMAFRLLVALLLGALVGLQRGWVSRSEQSGVRVAGIRTHTLTGLAGGLAALLSTLLSPWILPSMLLVIAAVAISGYRAQAADTRNYSITGVIGLLLTFCFGALAGAGEAVIAAMAAVITTMILDNKQEIHAALHKLQEHELDAALKLLLISVVLLPLLPNRGMGPGDALNPYEIWWMVVLIASVSFVGYFSVRIAGTRRGLLFTSLFAGLSSSTALTLHFARLARQSPANTPLLGAGILLACGTMFPRILLYALLLSPTLVKPLLTPLLVMMLVLYVPVILTIVRHQNTSISQPELAQNPLDLKAALILGALLVIIMLLAEWLRHGVGDTGIYLLATLSGITDVDAISLSLLRLSQTDALSISVATTAIVMAASANNLFKAALALGIGRLQLGIRVGVPMLASLVAGLATFQLMA